VCQSVVLTRTAVRASAMPGGEELVAFARTGATLAVHLSINNLARVCRELAPVLGEDCPVAVVYRASWPDELVLRGTLATIREKVKADGITRTALILVRPHNRRRAGVVIDSSIERIGGYVVGNVITSAVCGATSLVALLALGVPFAVPLAGVLWVLLGAAYRNVVVQPRPRRPLFNVPRLRRSARPTPPSA